MKKTFAILLAVMMLVTLFPMVTAEEAIDVIPAESIPEENVEIEISAEDPEIEIPAAEEPAAEETDDEEPVAEEPAQEEPVAEELVTEEPAAEEPAQEEPVQEEPVAEEPAAEEPAAAEVVEAEEPVQEEPVAEEAPTAEEVPAVEEAIEEVPVAEEPVTVEDVQEEVPAVEEPVIEETPAEEIPAVEETAVEEIPAVEEPVAEEIPAVEEAVVEEAPAVEEAAPVFTGTIGVVLVGSSNVEIGQYVTMHAIVENANMAYSIQWQKRNPASDEKWTNIEDATDEYYIIIATESAGNFIYRAILEAEDGTVAIAVYPISLNIIVPEEETVEEGIPAAEEKITQEEPEQTEFQEEEIIDELDFDDIEFEAEEIRAIADYNTALGMNDYQTITLEANDDEFAEINVREDADGLSAIFTSLPAGATLTVVDIEGDWAHVVIDDQEGYIYVDDLADYIEIPEEETEETEDPAESMKVTIFSSRRSVMMPGEMITLSSKLEGFEGYEIKYQWECNTGNGFQPVDGGDGETYTFELNDESLTWTWQLRVLYR